MRHVSTIREEAKQPSVHPVLISSPAMSPAKKPSAARDSARKTAREKTRSKKTAAGKSAPKKTARKSSSTKTSASRAKNSKTSKTTTSKGTKTTASAPKSSPKTSARKAPAGGSAKKTAAKASERKAAPVKPAASPPPAVSEPATAPKRRGKRPGLPPLTLKKTAAKKASPARAAKFDKGELAEIRQRLEAERAELDERIEEIEANVFEKTQSDLTGEAGFDEDFADAGTATFDRERELSIQNNIRDLIGQINRAISRIDEGTYGTCERCGRPIDASRLKALPHALLCMDCKRREERAR
jgi:RNA polymerase-binding protein DksA